MKWQKKLTKTERNHFYYATKGRMTIEAFKESRKAQLELEPVYGCCMDCYRIAHKLELEPDIETVPETIIEASSAVTGPQKIEMAVK
jgi:hypothetical protein